MTPAMLDTEIRPPYIDTMAKDALEGMPTGKGTRVSDSGLSKFTHSEPLGLVHSALYSPATQLHEELGSFPSEAVLIGHLRW